VATSPRTALCVIPPRTLDEVVPKLLCLRVFWIPRHYHSANTQYRLHFIRRTSGLIPFGDRELIDSRVLSLSFFSRFHEIAKSDYQLRRVFLFVRPRGKPRLSLVEFSRSLISDHLEKSVEQIQVYENLARINGTLHEHLFTFMINI
jgi:hypothetical protein